MNHNKLVDLILILGIAFCSSTLWQASSNPNHFLNFLYLRSVASIGFVLIAVYIFKRNGMSRDMWLSNIMIILSILMAAFFMLHVDRKFYWMRIERYASFYMAIPIVIFSYDSFKTIDKAKFLNKLKDIFTAIFSLSIITAILCAVAYFLFFRAPEEKNDFYKLDTEQQIQKLDWSSIVHSKWLTLRDDHTFIIESKAPEGKKSEIIERGSWVFNKDSRSITLSSKDISETYYYYLDEYGYALLGATPIENSLIGKTWEAFIPKENSQNDDWQSGWDNS